MCQPPVLLLCGLHFFDRGLLFLRHFTGFIKCLGGPTCSDQSVGSICTTLQLRSVCLAQGARRPQLDLSRPSSESAESEGTNPSPSSKEVEGLENCWRICAIFKQDSAAAAKQNPCKGSVLGAQDIQVFEFHVGGAWFVQTRNQPSARFQTYSWLL